MNPYEPLYQQLQDGSLQAWVPSLRQEVEQRLSPDAHGDMPRWQAALDSLPALQARHLDLNRDTLLVGDGDEVDEATRGQVEQGLRGLMPWRKGPFDIFGVHIDTEWRSDWKWQRVSPHLSPLAGRKVLDVGSGSGYHCWRMAGAGAELVLGIDPSCLFAMQYQAVQRFLPGEVPVYVVPLGIQEMPADNRYFDTVFSMGVLYHRRSPIDHLLELRGCLRSGGELVLETLVVDGDARTALVPEGRYGQMRNVWFIPSPAMLENWLQRCGLRDIRLVDLNQTSLEEQRSTDWMRFDSLADFLDPQDSNRTIEGYPAPKRAVFIATAP